MSIFRAYLERQQPPVVSLHIPVEGDGSTLFVAIPCHDEPDLITSLQSLADCDPPASGVTVIVVVNSSDQAPSEVLEHNEQTIREVSDWWKSRPRPFYQLCLLQVATLPSKWAGVGWARKIAMDEAIRQLEQSGKEEGILIAFDADSTVSKNYFRAIETVFKKNPGFHFANLSFSHPVDLPGLTPFLREGIIRYELYLRYLRSAMQWGGYPHAIHTVGSSFAVKATSYIKQGGMNRRKAGEDFHFLHKMVLLGDYGIITDATVYPAARVSHRVPFGTGAALQRWEEGDPELYSAYSLKIFETLQPLFLDPGFFFNTDQEIWEERVGKFDPLLQNYLTSTDTLTRLVELKKNCADLKTFTRRFYHLVNAFWIIQYLNNCEKTEGGTANLVDEAHRLIIILQPDTPGELTVREMLEGYRRMDGVQ